MKKGIKILIGLLALLFLFEADEAVASERFEVEQIQECMPQVKTYIRSSFMLDKEDIQVWIDEMPLEISEICSFSETEEKLAYYILVDISASIPNRYFTKEKEALIAFVESLGENHLTLISFGDEVTELFAGTGDNKDAAVLAINSMKNKDKETHLFEAISKTADLSDALGGEYRKVVMVLTDGEDFATGKTTKEEVKEELGDRNIPVYGMGIADTKKENLNSFGEIVRTLGGELYIFDEAEVSETLALWKNDLNHSYVVYGNAKSNKVDNKLHNCRVQSVSKNLNRNREIYLTDYMPDNVAPLITAVSKADSGAKLKVEFSEPVGSVSNVNNWSVFRNGVNVTIISADYGQENNIVYLNLATEVYEGTYTIAAPGVVDDSMEANAVGEEIEVKLDGKEAPGQSDLSGEDITDKSGEGRFSIWLIVIPVILLLIILLVILLIWIKIKRNKGVVYVEGKATLISNVEEKQKIHVESAIGIPVSLSFINNIGSDKQKIEARINGSLIVGRADYCDVSIDDGSLSKQHFALEADEEMICITDLETTNGTKVNGVKITQKYKLDKGDVIQAGSLLIRIEW